MSNGKPKPSKEQGKSVPGQTAPQSRPRQLSKSNKNCVLGGVCGGLAEHTDVPAWGWRVMFLWIVLPPDKSFPKPVVPPLFRKSDWISFAVTAVLVFIGYYITLAPDLTLEDSGELAVGSFYAGVPHPPGYPVWTIYTWLFTVLFPISNVAWRVALSSAVAGALACGLIALLASRGSSMILEGIEELKNIDKKWENALCLVAGYVAGMLIGFNGFMWSQAVIVEVYPFSLLSFMGVLCCLLRWIYAPEQRRYIYWALFLFGISFTNHMTLIVAAIGIEVAIAAARPKLGRDLFLINSILFIGGLIAKANGMLTGFDQNKPLFFIFILIGVLSMLACGYYTLKTQHLGTEFHVGVVMGLFWVLGASFYLFMPIASSTNPPMNWGYPRTWEGFLHALTRGQYEKTNPTSSLGRFSEQMWMLLSGAVEEFNFAYLLVGLIPFFFYKRMQKREQAWFQGLVAMYLFLSVLLIVLLNPSPDRQSRDMNRVFFTASHVMISLCVGYGLTLFGALMVTQYQRFRTFGLYGGAVVSAIALYAVTVVFQSDKDSVFSNTALFGMEASFYWLDRFTALFSLGLAVLVIGVFLIARHRAPLSALLAVFALMPVKSILSHWEDNEQRGHLFGYWFGHDMFTPPFTGPDGKLTYDRELREQLLKKPEGKLIYPEMARDAILFGGTDPGRFCPTYMIFCESFIPPRCKRDPEFDRRDVYIITQNALADGTYLEYIRAHYNRSTQVDRPFFEEMLRTKSDVARGTVNGLARLAHDFLDVPLTKFGARVEARRRAQCVYPKVEIHTPTPEEHQQCFNEYMMDVNRRVQLNQLKPGEDVRIDQQTGRLQVQGQVAVMSINGLLTKVIFDQNPTNEFYVEESFPLDWMYPYLEPYGVIMKINRRPLAEIPDEIVRKDHEFWSRYSERLIGNWITYDTPVKEICDFVERVYERHDFKGFKVDTKFIRDDQAQKSFSKLRSSIGGVYSWRVSQAKTAAEQQRMLREADFAFRQAFAFCPYSPEAVFRYTTLLATSGRLDDAELITETCLKFDSENPNIKKWINDIRAMKKGQGQINQAQQKLAQLEEQLRTNPHDARLAFDLSSLYLQMQRTNAALNILDQLITNPKVDANTLLSVANAYVQLQQGPRLETALKRLVVVSPESPEAWYDLATTETVLGKGQEAIQALKNALELSGKRLAQQPGARDLRKDAATNNSFFTLRTLPEFQMLTAAPQAER